MEFQPIALGAVFAAGITGLVTLLGLIISKEQKTSEFRQEWIDSLRSEVSGLLCHLETAVQHVRAINLDIKDAGERNISYSNMFEKVKNEVVESERYYHKILLRINPLEHVELVKSLEKIRLALNSGNVPTPKELHEMEKELIEITQAILKSEWCRVKKGERIFRVSKYSAVVILLLSIIVSGYIVIKHKRDLSGADNQTKVKPIISSDG